MGNIVFVLGAGASAKAGAPLMANFLDSASDLDRSEDPGAVQSKEDFKLVFRPRAALQRVHSKATLDLNNLEEVFAAFEMAALTERLPGIELEDVKKLPEAMERLIGVTLDRRIEFPGLSGPEESGWPAPPSPYGEFRELLTQLNRGRGGYRSGYARTTVITFNYSLVSQEQLLGFSCWFS